MSFSMLSKKTVFTLGLLFSFVAACRAAPRDAVVDAAPSTDATETYSYPKPKSNVVTAVGSDSTFEIATWNIENFPKLSTTPEHVADVIASLDLDMVVLEEVQDVAAFKEVVERLRGYEGILSSHTYSNGNYQKLGYIYRSSLVQLSGAFLLFTQDGYEFPRPPFKVDVVVNGSLRFTSIGLHLKAGVGFQDRARREDAVVILERFLKTTVNGPGNNNIVVLGDYNNTVSGSGAFVFGPLNNNQYDITTKVNDNAGESSFIPTSALIDHIVTTQDFDTNIGRGTTIIPRLDEQMSGYERQLSDHLPVILRVPLP